jgi:hypothetical protein
MTREQYDTMRRQADELWDAIKDVKGAVYHDAKPMLDVAWAKLLMYELANGINPKERKR